MARLVESVKVNLLSKKYRELGLYMWEDEDSLLLKDGSVQSEDGQDVTIAKWNSTKVKLTELVAAIDSAAGSWTKGGFGE